jgi:hypothetical protein
MSLSRRLSPGTLLRPDTPAHLAFWEPTIPSYWEDRDLTQSKSGFPCFLAFLYQPVCKGEQGEEDPSRILDDLIYVYPTNLPVSLQQALVGGIISFTTFSRLNLDCLLTSFSWSESEIAIQSVELADHKFITFALKLPNFFSGEAADRLLTQALNAYRMISPLFCGDLTSEDIPQIRELFSKNEIILSQFTFEGGEILTDPLAYGARPLKSFLSKSALATATQLYDFLEKMSPSILGSAFFYGGASILSSMPHRFTSLLLLLEAILRDRQGKKEEQFTSLPLWIAPQMVGSGESAVPVPMVITVIESGDLSIFVLLDRQSEIDAIIESVTKLLLNGLQDFALECASFSDSGKTKASGTIALWPDTGIMKASPCPTPVLQKMAEYHDDFTRNQMVQELITCDGQTQVTGIRLIDVEVFIQADSKGSYTSMTDTYARLKTFLPNLPSDIQKL